MKLALTLMLLCSFAHAQVPMTMKDRVRLSLWMQGLEDKPIVKKKTVQKTLPEELDRALRKI